jgi:hypothetical protein
MEMISSSQELDSKQGQTRNTCKRNPVAVQCPSSIDPPQTAPSEGYLDESNHWHNHDKLFSKINSEFKKKKTSIHPFKGSKSGSGAAGDFQVSTPRIFSV